MSSSRIIEFNLLDNAKDSLRQAVQLLAFNDIGNFQSQLKHAILHTAHCVELLLKERLQRVNPAQVLTKPNKYPNDSAHTVTVETAIKRLQTVGGVTLTTEDRKAVKDLCDARNEIMHREWKIQAKDAKVIIGEGLGFIFGFAKAELGMDLAKEFQADDTWRILLLELYQFTESYRKRVQTMMYARGDDPVECTNCGEEAAPWHGGICELCGYWQELENVTITEC